MTTTHVVKDKQNPVAAKLDAEKRESDARQKVAQAEAEARVAHADMDEISGVAAARKRVKQDAATFKQKAAANYAAAKNTVAKGIKEVEADMEHGSDRFRAWDAARSREFHARLDAAEAQLKVWKAKVDKKRAALAVKSHDELANLEEKIAFARARSAEAKAQNYAAKAQEALENAARHFEEAYDAAAKRYESF